MARKKDPLVRLGLYVTDKRDGDWYHIDASVVTIGLNAYEKRCIDDDNMVNYRPDATFQTIRNASDEDLGGLYLNNLRATSQGDNDSTPRRLYGFELRYHDVYAIDAHTAGRMARTLTTINRRMAKLVEKFGHPATFGQYLARVATAIKADAFVRPATKYSRGWSYGDNEQNVMAVGAGIYAVDQMADDWIREHELKGVSNG